MKFILDCQIQILGDQSVSRKHAWITVSQNGSTTVSNLFVKVAQQPDPPPPP